MDWLTHSFQQYTVAWVLISSIIGGVTGAAARFVFEDILRPFLGWRRETRKIVSKYMAPLVRSANSVERRINILVRNEDKRWYDTDESFRLATLYQFGELLGWIRILEREFGFLPVESTKRGREFNTHLTGVFRALSSHGYFHRSWYPKTEDVEASAVPRLMMTAIGEVMTRDGNKQTVIDFTAFHAAYTSDPKFRAWFHGLDAFLRAAHPSNPLHWDRLILAGAHLYGLIRLLDPKCVMVPQRGIANLETLRHPQVREQVEKAFPALLS